MRALSTTWSKLDFNYTKNKMLCFFLLDYNMCRKNNRSNYVLNCLKVVFNFKMYMILYF